MLEGLSGRNMVTRQEEKTIEGQYQDELKIDFAGSKQKKPSMSKKNNLNEDSDWDLDNY